MAFEGTSVTAMAGKRNAEKIYGSFAGFLKSCDSFSFLFVHLPPNKARNVLLTKWFLRGWGNRWEFGQLSTQ